MLGFYQKESCKKHESQHKPNNDNGTQNIQFSLEFVVAGRNSVQQMVEPTAFFPSCHGNASFSKYRATRTLCAGTREDCF